MLGLGEDLGKKVLSLQAQNLYSHLRTHIKELGMEVCACNARVEMGRSLMLAGHPTKPTG